MLPPPYENSELELDLGPGRSGRPLRGTGRPPLCHFRESYTSSRAVGAGER
jgi:hypothetical protein